MSNVEKEYDAVAGMRTARDRIGEQIAGLSPEEEREWLRSQDLRDRTLQRLRELAGRTTEPAGR